MREGGDVFHGFVLWSGKIGLTVFQCSGVVWGVQMGCLYSCVLVAEISEMY